MKLPIEIWIGGGALLALLLMFVWVKALKTDIAERDTTIANLERDMAKAEADAREAKENIESTSRAQIELARLAHHTDLINVSTAHARTLADLRGGSQRLRWSLECPAAADLPEAAAGTPGAADPAELRRADAQATVADAIALADACDADIRFAHGVIRADRGGEPLP